MDRKITIAVELFENDPFSIKFDYISNGENLTGFALLFEGTYYVYKNQCQHPPVELDWEGNQFFDEENKFIICATHGAIYQPETGLCVGGPCNGKKLTTMPFEIEEDSIVVTI